MPETVMPPAASADQPVNSQKSARSFSLRDWFGRSAPTRAAANQGNPAKTPQAASRPAHEGFTRHFEKLEREAADLTHQEELFYNLMMRVGLLGDLRAPLAIKSETQRNMTRRRLDGEANKLVAIMQAMETGIDAIKLAVMELRACHFSAQELDLRTEREALIDTVGKQLEQAERSMVFIEEIAERIANQLDWLATSAAPKSDSKIASFPR